MITWDSNNLKYIILSNNNLTGEKNNGGYEGVKSSESRLNGKYYWEITINSMVENYYRSDIIIGICNEKQKMNGFSSCGGFTDTLGYYDFGDKLANRTYVEYGEKYSESDVISVLLDLDNSTLEFWKNGISQGVAFENIEKTEWYPCVFAWSKFRWTVNFGAEIFKYKMPQEYEPFDYKSAKWFTTRYLIKKDNNYFSIKTSYQHNNIFLPLKFNNRVIPNKEDYEIYGFDSLDKLIAIKDQTTIDGLYKDGLEKGKLFEFKLNNEIREMNSVDTDITYDLYNSQFSKGDRQKLIKVTCTDGLIKGGNTTDLIDGQNKDSFYFYEKLSNQWILFEFQESVCVQQFKWSQSNNVQHGKWVLQGSNDNIKFDNLGESFTLTNGTFNIRNYKKYKHYKLQQIEGITVNTPWLYEIEFGINPNTLRYLIEYKNQLYTLNENEMILSPSQELTEDNFKINGFESIFVVWDIILNKIDDKNNIKLLVYTEDLNVKEMELECRINPYRPIDILRKQLGDKIEILKFVMK